jgi:hypothetical protein
MKALLVFAVLMLATTRALLCDDFKTVDGKEYKNVTVSRTEPDGIIVTSNSGIIKLYFSELPPDVRTKYNYNPKKARDFAAADARQQQLIYEQAQRDRAAIAQRQAAAARAAEQNKQTTTSKDVPHENVPRGTALEQRPSGQEYFLQGRVVQVVEGKGILLSTVKSTAFGIPEPPDHSLVFVAGTFNPTLDYEDVLAMNATEAGTYRYTTVQGAAKTVAAYRSAISRTPIAPFVLDSASHRYIEP